MRAPSMLSGLALASIASLAWCTPALGQWTVGAEIGSDRFWGGSVQSTGERRSLRPYRPTTLGLGIEGLGGGRFGAGLRLRYASAGLALEGADALVAVKGVFTVYSAAPEMIYRIATLGTGNRLVLHAGPLFEVWSVVDEPSQTRVGVQSALSLYVPLGGRLAGSLLAGIALTPSPFARDQLDRNFERRALWRRRLSTGFEYRL